jgi:hypothetical protein
MSGNILSNKENNLEEQYPLVDPIQSLLDNSEQWLIDTD